MAQHPQQGEQPCPAQAAQGAAQESERDVPGARSFRVACLMHFMSPQCGDFRVLVALAAKGGFLLAIPVLQTNLPAPLNSRALDMHPEDGSDTPFSPRQVLAHEAETAGAVMAFFLSLGLALGAAVSFLFRILI